MQPHPLTAADVNAALAFMDWQVSDELAAKVAGFVIRAGSVRQALSDVPSFEMTDADRALLRYGEALRLKADPVAAAEALTFQAECDHKRADQCLKEAAYRQGAAATRLERGDVSGAIEDQTRAVRETAMAVGGLAKVQALRSRAATLLSTVAA